MNLIKLADNSFAVENKGHFVYGTMKQAFRFLHKQNLTPASEFLIAMEDMLKKNHNIAHFGTFGNRGFMFTKEVDVDTLLPAKGSA